MKKLFIKSAFTLIIIYLGTLSGYAFSQTVTPVRDAPHTRLIADDPGIYKPAFIPKPDTLPGPEVSTEEAQKNQRTTLGERLLPKFAISLIGMVGASSLLFLVIGGIRYVTLYGNEEGVDKAKNQVMYAIIGLLIAMLSYTIVTIVTNIKIEGNSSTGQFVGPPQPKANP